MVAAPQKNTFRKQRQGERVGVFWSTVEASGIGISQTKKAPYIWIRVRCLRRYDPKLGDSACDFLCRGYLWLSSKHNIEYALRTMKEVFNLDINYQQITMLDDPWALKGKPCEATVEQYLTPTGGRGEQVRFFDKAGHFKERLSARLPQTKKDEVLRKVHDIVTAPEAPATTDGESWNDL